MLRLHAAGRLALAVTICCTITYAVQADEVLVAFKPGTPADLIEQLKLDCGVTQSDACYLPGLHVMTVPAGGSAQELIAFFAARDEVSYAEVNGILATPIDPDPVQFGEMSIPDPGEPIPLDLGDIGIPPIVDPVPLAGASDAVATVGEPCSTLLLLTGCLGLALRRRGRPAKGRRS